MADNALTITTITETNADDAVAEINERFYAGI